MPFLATASTDRPLLAHHVARRLGVSERTVRHWAATGQIEAYKVGPKIWRFPRRCVDSVDNAAKPHAAGVRRARRPALGGQCELPDLAR